MPIIVAAMLVLVFVIGARSPEDTLHLRQSVSVDWAGCAGIIPCLETTASTVVTLGFIPISNNLSLSALQRYTSLWHVFRDSLALHAT